MTSSLPVIKYTPKYKSNLDEWILSIKRLGQKIKDTQLNDIVYKLSIKPTGITFSDNGITYEGDSFNNLLNTIRDLNALIVLLG